MLGNHKQARSYPTVQWYASSKSPGIRSWKGPTQHLNDTYKHRTKGFVVESDSQKGSFQSESQTCLVSGLACESICNQREVKEYLSIRWFLQYLSILWFHQWFDHEWTNKRCPNLLGTISTNSPTASHYHFLGLLIADNDWGKYEWIVVLTWLAERLFDARNTILWLQSVLERRKPQNRISGNEYRLWMAWSSLNIIIAEWISV